MASNECITVVVRCRPLNRKETEENRKSIIGVDIPGRQVSIQNPDTPNEAPKSFTFDATYDDKTQQRVFYEESCFSIIDSTLEGFNSTIFAYGQTGCGKSFTMQGPSTTDEEMKGVIPNSFSHIFQCVRSTPNVEFLIRCSYLELYNEEIRDLLGNPKTEQKVELKEDPNKGVFVKGLTDVVVESPDDLYKMLDKGLSHRTVAATLMNSESSRSHSIFSIIIEMNTKDEATGKDLLRVGKLNLVDLAGSERAKKTGAKGATLQEGIKINLSLSVLGNVISALAEGGRHIPYRDSKLTRLLQDSLGGNTKTMMVAAISPADYNYEETLSTLRYANRAKNIKNKPKINEDPKDAMIREFKAEIDRLKKLLSDQAGGLPLEALLAAAAPPQQQQATRPPKPKRVVYKPVEAEQQDEEEEEEEEEVPVVRPPPKKAAASKKKLAPVASAATSAAAQEQEYAPDQEQDQGGEDMVVQSVDSPRHSPSKVHAPLAAQAPGDDEVEAYDDAFEELSPDKRAVGGASSAMGETQQYEDEFESPEQQQIYIRDELAKKLHQLEHMLVNHEEEMVEEETSSGQGPVALQTVASVRLPKTSEQLREDEEASRKYKERKQKAKRKKEEQQRELERVLEEKRAMEDELEELRQQSKASTAQLDEETVSKRIAKIKKKYEKRLDAQREEMEELREEFYQQRKQLLDEMIEQEKDLKLYELICRAVLTEKDLAKIVERCQYDDERDEWVLPFTKKKKASDLPTMDMSPGLGGKAGGGGGSLLPDINQGGAGGGGGGHLGAMNMNFNANLPAVRGVSGGDPNLRLVSGPSPPVSARPTSHSRPGPGQVSSGGGGGLLPAAQGSNNRSSGPGSGAGSSSGTPSRSFVPLLALPGSLVSASDAMSNAAAGADARLPGLEGEVGIGYDMYREEKKPKKKNKVPKASAPKSQVEKMPVIGGPSAPAAAAAAALSARGDRDESTAGPVESWDWSVDDKKMPPIRNGKALLQPDNPELEYSDDEDFVSTDPGKKKKKKKKRTHEDGGLPPIDHKHATPRGGGTSLPPI